MLHFLRTYGYPVPESLLAVRPRVALLESSSPLLASAKRALSRRFDVVAYADPLAGLLALSGLDVDAVVLDDIPLGDGCVLPASACIERLKQLDGTKHLRIIVFSSRAEARAAAMSAGAAEFVLKGGEELRSAEGAKLREAVERATALRVG